VLLSNIARLYVVRLRARVVLIQELLALLGIAVGVALLFASQVATTSLNGSVKQLTNEVVGRMQFQLDTRKAQGFDQRLLGEVQRLPGVRAALPVIEASANIVGPTGQEAVDLIGTEPRFARLGSPLLAHFSYAQLAKQKALALPTPIAQAIGAGPLEVVKMQVGAKSSNAVVGTELNAASIGVLVHSPVVVAPLAYAQQLAGRPGRLSRIFVQAEPGHAQETHAGLLHLAAGELNVEPADFDATLFRVAAAPVNQSEGSFSAISALVGFMFAINAMLLTLPLRRGLIRGLRASGASRLDAVKALLLDALVLGGLACVLGLALGDVISLYLFNAEPGYLSLAFPVGSQRIITWQSAAIAVAAGLLAACAGALVPLRELWSRSARLPEPGEHRLLTPKSGLVLAAAVACLAATSIILVAAPQSAVLGSATLVMALVILLPLLFDSVLTATDRLQRRWGRGAVPLAVVELRSPKTRVRSLAVAATGAIAVFGIVAIQGAHANLQRGLDGLFHDVTATTDIWVLPPGPQNLLATVPFQGDSASRLARLPGVQTLGVYRGGFLEYGDRRLWVLAPPQNAHNPIPPSQLTAGTLTTAIPRLRKGGWAILSKAVADDRGLHIGQSFLLPAPHPRTFRIAALITNLGWPPGAVIINPDDYKRAWGTADASAYNITLRSGASPQLVSGEIRRALGPSSALRVQTARQREQLQLTASRQGLARLSEISTLVIIATTLAISIAMSAMIWQRRPQFARMKAQGYSRRVLWAALVLESALLLGAGCSIGAAFGIYGQLLLSHALATVTGFPIVFSASALVAFTSFALVSALAVAIVALPGYRATSVPPYI
jgi:putative ABC transport system permease protein